MNKAILLLFFIAPLGAFSQNNEHIQLNSAQFKTGDDPAWKKPGYDDHSWATIQTGKNWEDQGFPDYDGYAWYRLHVNLRATPKEGAGVK